jgi:hypothetical protein
MYRPNGTTDEVQQTTVSCKVSTEVGKILPTVGEENPWEAMVPLSGAQSFGSFTVDSKWN